MSTATLWPLRCLRRWTMSQKPPADREELAISHARAYTAPGVTVFYDRGRCLHFAECVRGLPQVFDLEKRPWIQPENASAEQVAEVRASLCRCGRTENEPFCAKACSRTGWTLEPPKRDNGSSRAKGATHHDHADRDR